MKNATKNVAIEGTSENSILGLAKEMNDNATRMINHASSADHSAIDAAIYLSKAAEELKNGVGKNVICVDTSYISPGRRNDRSDSHMKKIILITIVIIAVTSMIYMIKSYSEKLEPPVSSEVIQTNTTGTNQVIPNNTQSITPQSNINENPKVEEEKIPYANKEEFKKEKVIAAMTKHLGGVFTGKMNYIYTNCKQYNVNPMLVTAIMKHETGNGTSKMVRVQNNPAGISTPSGGFATYKTLDAGIMRLITLLKSYYIDRGLNNIESIGEVFCPISDVRDVNKLNSSWIPTVAKYYKEILADSKN